MLRILKDWAILIGVYLYLVVETVYFNIVLSIVVLRKIGNLHATKLYRLR